jgi:aspartyl-tRNA(Asn)/glutamyl-tRNA(Gln) amidotransferase subunit A
MNPSTQSRRTFLQAATTAAAGVAVKPAVGGPQDLASLTLKKAAELLRRKGASPVELTQACLERIARYNSTLNAFITVTSEQAMAAAREMEAEQRKGKWRGPLHGIPIALKDNIDTAGVRTTGASELFKDRIPSEDAEVVRRLKMAGAILLGKLNLHEFAYGGTCAVSYFGPVHNPWNPALTPGGSSGGPGAAVAADLCFASLGTDTAGSVRIPASYCSVTGLKPTYGRVSLQGVIPLSWSRDHVGPLCKTVEDTALMLSAIAGYDERDPATADVPVSDYARSLGAPTAKLRLGIARKPFFDNLHPDVARAMAAALAVLGKLTAGMSDIELPQMTAGPIIVGVEAYSYHAQWLTKTPELYQPQVRAELQRSADIKAEEYARALRELAQIRRNIKKVFATVDLLILPTMADPPFRIEEGLNREVSVRNTGPFDAYGIPVMSLPCGFTSDGLPIGMQIAGAPWAEATVLRLAHAYERETAWHTMRPKLTPA